MLRGLPPLVVMGVSGCGKSTVGSLLGMRLGIPFADGDDFHPIVNRQKMASGIPLTDEDRVPWLADIGRELSQVTAEAESRIIACSALKRSYRDLLRRYAPTVVFIHLSGDADLISCRLAGRQHEYMPSSLLTSQLAVLEKLEADESHILINIGQHPEVLVDRIAKTLLDMRWD
jgi:gluconokinase